MTDLMRVKRRAFAPFGYTDRPTTPPPELLVLALRVFYVSLLLSVPALLTGDWSRPMLRLIGLCFWAWLLYWMIRQLYMAQNWLRYLWVGWLLLAVPLTLDNHRVGWPQFLYVIQALLQAGTGLLLLHPSVSLWFNSAAEVRRQVREAS